jgi:hypothetical protein
MSHFIDVCECGITLRQCRCPGPKTEHVITPCKHEPKFVKPDITDLLREELRQSLVKTGRTEEQVEALLLELEEFTAQQVAKIKERGRKQT